MENLSGTDLVDHLQEQIDFLKLSSSAFDGGFEGEAKRIAVVLRTLLHDTQSCTSVLSQVGLKQIPFLDTNVIFGEANLMNEYGLVSLRLATTATDVEAGYVARLDNFQHDAQQFRDFTVWWEETPVIWIKPDRKFTRKELVLTVADKDGGAHVDPKLDSTYYEITRKKMHTFDVVVGGVPMAMPNSPILPSVRQVSHEVLVSLLEVERKIHALREKQ